MSPVAAQAPARPDANAPTTYVVGHKNPDADAICSAIAYAAYKQARGERGYLAARCGNSNARIDTLIAAKTDPISGQPALKMSLVTIEPAQPAIYGFFVARRAPAIDAAEYWAIAEAPGGMRGGLGFMAEPPDWLAWVRAAFDVSAGTEIVSMRDPRSGRRSFSATKSGALGFAIYLSPDPVAVSRQWVVSQLAGSEVKAAALLAGRPGADVPDGGAIVCACFSVGINTIAEAVTQA
eukprot:gene55703-74383_t